MNQQINHDPDIQQYMETVNVGLWGLVLKALQKEGAASKLATLDAVQSGRAFVEVKVLLTKRGISTEGHFCSHGAKGHLFSVNLNHPPATDEPPTDTAVH